MKSDPVSEGHDPTWRVAWEEHLTHEQRREIEQAVKHGKAVSDPTLRRLALGLARRWRRREWLWIILYPAWLALTGLQIYATCFLSRSLFCWFYMIIGLLWLTVIPVKIAMRYRRLNEAEMKNREGA